VQSSVVQAFRWVFQPAHLEHDTAHSTVQHVHTAHSSCFRRACPRVPAVGATAQDLFRGFGSNRLAVLAPHPCNPQLVGLNDDVTDPCPAFSVSHSKSNSTVLGRHYTVHCCALHVTVLCCLWMSLHCAVLGCHYSTLCSPWM